MKLERVSKLENEGHGGTTTAALLQYKGRNVLYMEKIDVR
jgi:hypothetical protein